MEVAAAKSMSFRNLFFRMFLLFFFLTGLGSAMMAQVTASIKGTVTDASGASVAGAKVVVKSAARGLERNAESNTAGEYEVPALPQGSYDVEVQKAGFETQIAKGVVLQVSQNTLQSFSLKVAQTNTVVTVESTQPVIDATTITVGQVIDQNVVQDIPLNGRHFVDLALLVPGTVTPPSNGFLTAPLRGQGSFAFNSAGGREDAVNFMINGINLSDMVQNQVTFQPSISTVSEFKIDNSTYSAEYGRNSGSIVNIATRSGTEELHGEAYDYVRNNWFDARNFFNPQFTSTGAPNPQSALKRNQFGGDFGGPIKHRKTYFFLSYEGLRHRQGLTTTSPVLSDAQRTQIQSSGSPSAQGLLSLIPPSNGLIGTPPAFFGSATAPVNINQGSADIGHNLSESDHLHGYYIYQADLRQEPTAGANIPGFGDTREGHRQAFTLGETHIFSPALVNEARLGVNHFIITYSPYNTNALDFFTQDSYKLKPFLTLELGLRYSWNKTPSEAKSRFVVFDPGTVSLIQAGAGLDNIYNQNSKNFQPRAGFAWDAWHNGKTIVRGGYGYQVDQPITGIITGLASNPPFALPISVTFPPAAPGPVSTLGTNFSGTPASVSPLTINPDFRNANVQSWNLNVQRQVTNDMGIMIGYFGAKGTHLEIDRNLNQPTVLGSSTSRPFRTLQGSILPGTGLGPTITERDSSSNSIYHALWITANKRISHGLQFNASYTFSHSIDDNSRNAETIVMQDSTNVAGERGSSDFDVRHRFIVNAIYDLPFKGNRLLSGWQLASIVTAHSGNPFNVVIASASINGVSSTVRLH